MDLIFSSDLKENETIFTDSVKVTQILSNLINNAIKFTEKGWIKIKSRSVGNYLEVEIEDTGIGIALENQKIIFNRFRQVEESHTRKFGGNGLGLAISKGLVEKLGGSIQVKSKQGKGSLFFVYTTLAEKIVFLKRTMPINSATNSRKKFLMHS